MIADTSEGGVTSPAPSHHFKTRYKLRTISCSTEESGIDSLSTSSSLPSISSPSRTCPHGPSSPESETSDYRSSPSPSVSSSRSSSRAPRRRATIPPCSNSRKSCVSLRKLSLPAQDISCQEHPLKKIKIDPLHARGAEDETKSGLKLLQKKTKEKLDLKDEDSLIQQLKSDHIKTEDLKQELAHLDSILQGKFLFDKAFYKLTDHSAVKKEEDSFDDFKKDANISNVDKDSKVKNEESTSSKETHQPEDEHSNSNLFLEECKWDNCNAKIEVQHLLEHLMNVHVTPQKMQETETSRYQCLWSGCKVYSTCSTSFTWLSQHVTKHVAFVCIVPGCRQRFGNQISLSRHVNSHFKTPGGSSTTSNNNNNTKKQSNSNNSSPVKFYIRKTRRKLRSGVSHVNHLKMSEDTFHLGIMAGIKDGLSRISHSSHNSDNVPFIFDNCGADLVFRSEVKSRKLDENGNIQYLVKWLPEGMFEDEWLARKELKSRRSVAISHLPPMLKTEVENRVFGKQNSARNKRKLPRPSGPPKLT